MKKRKFIPLLAALLILAASLTACKQSPPTAEIPVDGTSSSVLKAWTGEFSEDALVDAIRTYEAQYQAVTFDAVKESQGKAPGETSYLSFATDFEVASCTVSRLSSVNESDPNGELHTYIDRMVETKIDRNTVTIHTGWWHGGGDWVKKIPVWSYLVRMTDTQGTTHWYYFHTDYSMFMNSAAGGEINE